MLGLENLAFMHLQKQLDAVFMVLGFQNHQDP